MDILKHDPLALLMSHVEQLVGHDVLTLSQRHLMQVLGGVEAQRTREVLHVLDRVGTRAQDEEDRGLGR